MWSITSPAASARLQANRLTAHILAAKARGVQLGNPANLSNQLGGRAKGNAAMAAKAAKRAADLLPLILPMKAGGASLRQIADGLNRCGVPAPRGGDWSAAAFQADPGAAGPGRRRHAGKLSVAGVKVSPVVFQSNGLVFIMIDFNIPRSI
jgi:hypothetical protein